MLRYFIKHNSRGLSALTIPLVALSIGLRALLAMGELHRNCAKYGVPIRPEDVAKWRGDTSS